MRLYSSWHRDKVDLPPPPGPIGMYVCGPTVYQRAHIGNARPFVVFSWLRNWLRARGYDVTHVQNITDINDKIYAAAPGASAGLARDATRWYVEDTDDLGLGRPDHEPTAEGTVADQIRLIEELIAAGAAYEVDGDVYFRVSRFGEYGRLSGQRLDQVEDDEPNPRKEAPHDFALWKANKPDEDTWWESPWGRGRPGWHIECSAMAERYLGPEFEIHGGGLDLIFPHHENEIAQSRSVGRRFARIWMHNGMLGMAGQEMHKSLGNDVSLRNVLDRWGRETVLLYFLTGHWRKPIDFSDDVMAQAQAQVEAFRNAFHGFAIAGAEEEFSALTAALDDDFNTPEALALLHKWRSEQKVVLLRRGLEIFGLASLAETMPAPADVQRLALDRSKARDERRFEEADRLRRVIEDLGWEVRDEPRGFRLVPRS